VVRGQKRNVDSPVLHKCAHFFAMLLSGIINEIADQADDFLEGVAKREDARAAISEQITIKFPSLNGVDRAKVIQGVIDILEREGFFELRSESEGDDEVSDE
jgi:hypothetical protein